MLRKLVKALVALVFLVVLGVFAAYLVADKKLAAKYAERFDVPLPLTSLEGGDVATGERIVHVRNGCTDCHGKDLAGGAIVEDPLAGNLYGPNITPFALKEWSDGEIARAIRHGVGRDGRPLILMPSDEYNNLSLGDLKSVVAFLRTIPAVDKPTRAPQVGPLMKILQMAGEVNLFAATRIDHAKPFNAKPAEAPTAEFGKYLVDGACRGCHGQELTGGPIPGGPPDWAPAANLTRAALGKWTFDDFAKTLKTGVNPSGKTLGVPFPLALTSQMSEVELKAIWSYLESLTH